MNMVATAEGVETNEQKLFARQIGCDELQGYLLYRPVSAQQMISLIKVLRREAV